MARAGKYFPQELPIKKIGSKCHCLRAVLQSALDDHYASTDDALAMTNRRKIYVWFKDASIAETRDGSAAAGGQFQFSVLGGGDYPLC